MYQLVDHGELISGGDGFDFVSDASVPRHDGCFIRACGAAVIYGRETGVR